MRTRRLFVAVAALAIAAVACFPDGGPIIGDFRCPVDGSTYSNNYGPRGSGFHYGIDMIAPTGRPLWAVKTGNVQYALESAGGIVAYLVVDSDVFYYAHMSGTVGGNRRVQQGDAIGFVGQTGNATGPHLHFEMRLGSVFNAGTNPYNTLINAGC
jgi:murein DD-endopeptidase MepM/ murein hydrolase activator NlpD